VQIRPAKSGEAELLAAVAWAAKASWGYSVAQLESWRESLTLTEESLRGAPTYVAEVQGEVAGFYQLSVGDEVVELEHLWVHPRFMRRGVGRALLEHSAAYLAGVGVTSLHVDSDPNAEPFYAACGAVRVGEHAAPVQGQPNRVRPLLRLSTTQPNPSIERTATGKPVSAAHVER
jgi:GNAT superfamily N-acetyltransferase